jgi:hypothetical protein
MKLQPLPVLLIVAEVPPFSGNATKVTMQCDVDSIKIVFLIESSALIQGELQ